MLKPVLPPKTLGKVSAQLLQALLKKGKTAFTLDEALDYTASDYPVTVNLMARLVQRGLIARIKSGKYLILQQAQKILN